MDVILLADQLLRRYHQLVQSHNDPERSRHTDGKTSVDSQRSES